MRVCRLIAKVATWMRKRRVHPELWYFIDNGSQRHSYLVRIVLFSVGAKHTTSRVLHVERPTTSTQLQCDSRPRSFRVGVDYGCGARPLNGEVLSRTRSFAATKTAPFSPAPHQVHHQQRDRYDKYEQNQEEGDVHACLEARCALVARVRNTIPVPHGATSTLWRSRRTIRSRRGVKVRSGGG